MTSCPVCSGDVDVAPDVIEGEILPCAECGTELEVRSLAPLELAEAPAIEEDWGE